MKVESYHLRLPCSVLLLDDVPLFMLLSALWWEKGPASSTDAESNLPLGLCDFAYVFWSCVKQIMLCKHLFKLLRSYSM